MNLRATVEYPCQAWTVVILSTAACLLGLGQIAVGVWFYVYSIDFKLVIGIALHNVYIGYAALGLFTFVCGVLGSCSALLRRKVGLMMYSVLLLASIVCQGGVWAFIYIEQRAASREFAKEIAQHDEYHEFIDHQFNCDLSLFSKNSTAGNLEAEKCSKFLSQRLWTSTWAMLGVCAAQICLQFVLILMAVMLYQLVKEALRRARFEVPTGNIKDTAEREDNKGREMQQRQQEVHWTEPREQFAGIPSTPGYIPDNDEHQTNTTKVYRTVVM